jgi:hypothetical protein
MRRANHREGRKLGKVAVAALAVGGVAIIAGGAVLVYAALVQPEATASPSAAQANANQTSVVPSAQARPETDAAQSPTFGPDESVLLIGDSLAVGIAPQLAVELPQRQLVVEAEEGRNTATSVALVSDHVAYTPQIWVVSLGTNDNAVDFPSSARQLLDLAGANRCVLWFDVHRPGFDDPINDTLHLLALTHPNVHLLDWDKIADAHPEWFLMDGIHPEGDGYQVRTDMAAHAVNSVCTTPSATSEAN